MSIELSGSFDDPPEAHLSLPVDSSFRNVPELVANSENADGQRRQVVYDETGTKRYVASEFEILDHVRRRLSLEGMVGEGTWNDLVAGYEDINLLTGRVSRKGVSVERLNPETTHSDDIAGGVHVEYSTSAGRRSGYYFGYDGTPENVASDLADHGVVARTSHELPPRIDVEKTLDGLVDAFKRGSFDPPPLVEPKNGRELAERRRGLRRGRRS